MDLDPDRVERDMRRWLERAVIGLNLCPFAKAVHVKGQVHYVVSRATDWATLLAELERELLALAACDSEQRDTTLLVAPAMLADFLEFDALAAQGERVLAGLGLEGTLQLASFHPHFQFAGTEPDDITNFTNRAPHPTLHLLREASIDRAVQAFPDASAIYEANMATLRRLGPAGWDALWQEPTPSPKEHE